MNKYLLSISFLVCAMLICGIALYISKNQKTDEFFYYSNEGVAIKVNKETGERYRTEGNRWSEIK